ncbi:type VI secretion protein [Shewanella psychropiezotolerans]|uniref:Type VI secretion protein n=1 Tax=Shewanella psychropiezotolerans TaxID=2593655 RepID=A0ABX5WWB0_9GAMM|nr:type VI secretion system ImpA family N-terminal domain-containing protein [Shewanella psychropiezotolerans]QDO83364.1 type VI secretion protein [Shewanella psychropiezotolerans]
MLLSNTEIVDLLIPIDEDLPCGIYLKSDKIAFRPLRNKFNLAKTSLRKLSQNPSVEDKEQLMEENKHLWKALAESLMHSFRHVSRDIEFIAWFITAQVILDNSFESVANSLTWLADLIESRWDTLNPVLPIEKLQGGTEAEHLAEQASFKCKSFFQLAGDSEESNLLYGPLLLKPLVGEFTFFDYKSAQRKGEVNLLKERALGEVSREESIIITRLINVERCLKEIERLNITVSDKAKMCGVKPTNFSVLKNIFTQFNYALEQVSGLTAPSNHIEEQTTIHPQDKHHAEMESDEITDIPPAFTMSNLKQIAKKNVHNREQALNLLGDVAEYFRESEPHSPVSFLLQKAISWGNKPFPELLEELFDGQDSDVRSQIFNLVGVKRPD